MNKWIAFLCIITGSLMAADNDVVVSPRLSVNKHNKIAIFSEENKTDADARDISAFEASIELEFMRMGFNVIDRANINKILAEHQFSQTGIMTVEGAIDAGKILGTNAIVVLKYSGRSGVVFSSQMKMVDVETAAILISASFSGGGLSEGRGIMSVIGAAYHKSPSSVAKLFFDKIKAQIKK